MINRENSVFYMHSKAAQRNIHVVEEVTGLTKGKFLLSYLGCLIGHARQKKFILRS